MSFFFQAEDGIRDGTVTGVQTCALPISFRIAGAIVQVDKKFTKKEGKPFAVVWLEDLSATLEVVLWNEVYVTASERSEERRVGKSVDLGGRRIIKKKKRIHNRAMT